MLGLFLFGLYISSLCSVLRRHSLLFHVYAGGIQFVLPFFLLSLLMFCVKAPGVRREIFCSIHISLHLPVLRLPSLTNRPTITSFASVNYCPWSWYYLWSFPFLLSLHSYCGPHMVSHSSFSVSDPSFSWPTVSNQTNLIFISSSPGLTIVIPYIFTSLVPLWIFSNPLFIMSPTRFFVLLNTYTIFDGLLLPLVFSSSSVAFKLLISLTNLSISHNSSHLPIIIGLAASFPSLLFVLWMFNLVGRVNSSFSLLLACTIRPHPMSFIRHPEDSFLYLFVTIFLTFHFITYLTLLARTLRPEHG